MKYLYESYVHFVALLEVLVFSVLTFHPILEEGFPHRFRHSFRAVSHRFPNRIKLYLQIFREKFQTFCFSIPSLVSSRIDSILSTDRILCNCLRASFPV